MTNAEHYADSTADKALRNIAKSDHAREMKQKAIQDMIKIQEFAQTLGWRVQGDFHLRDVSGWKVDFRRWT